MDLIHPLLVLVTILPATTYLLQTTGTFFSCKERGVSKTRLSEERGLYYTFLSRFIVFLCCASAKSLIQNDPNLTDS